MDEGAEGEMNDDDYTEMPDEYYEDKHRRKLQGLLRHLPPGHPD